MTTVTVQKGQTLWGFAKTLCGKGASKKEIAAMTDKIAQENKIKDKNSIFAGQTIELHPLVNDIPDP